MYAFKEITYFFLSNVKDSPMKRMDNTLQKRIIVIKPMIQFGRTLCSATEWVKRTFSQIVHEVNKESRKLIAMSTHHKWAQILLKPDIYGDLFLSWRTSIVAMEFFISNRITTANETKWWAKWRITRKCDK